MMNSKLRILAVCLSWLVIAIDAEAKRASPSDDLQQIVSHPEFSGSITLEPGVYDQRLQIIGRDVDIVGTEGVIWTRRGPSDLPAIELELATVSIKGVRFADISLTESSIIEATHSRLQLEDCEFDSNSSSKSSIIRLVFSPAILKDCLFANNRSYHGSVFQDEQILLIDRCKFEQNTAECGAGVFSTGVCIAVGTEFIDNRANQHGGAVFMRECAGFYNCLFLGNRAEESGGAMWLGRPSTIVGALLIQNDSPGPGKLAHWERGELRVTHSVVRTVSAKNPNSSQLSRSPSARAVFESCIISETLCVEPGVMTGNTLCSTLATIPVDGKFDATQLPSRPSAPETKLADVFVRGNDQHIGLDLEEFIDAIDKVAQIEVGPIGFDLNKRLRDRQPMQ